ncbi:MAG: hypothetical protein HUJ53_00615 [Holdemanella sp.]|nr:hypothetical protein [Holdemanella sp.]
MVLLPGLPNTVFVRKAPKGCLCVSVVFRPAFQTEEDAEIYPADDRQENEKEVRIHDFKGYQINDALLKHAKVNVMVQHALPATRGLEITEEVFEAHADEIFEEAENRLHVQKAVVVKLLCKDKEN